MSLTVLILGSISLACVILDQLIRRRDLAARRFVRAMNIGR